jgi:hypothetical protein
VKDLHLDQQPTISGTPSVAAAPPEPGRRQQTEAKRDFIERFADKQVGKLMAIEIKKTFKLADSVTVEIQYRVLDKSADPAQKEFMTVDPEARILTASIKVSGDIGTLLQFVKSFRGNMHFNIANDVFSSMRSGFVVGEKDSLGF